MCRKQITRANPSPGRDARFKIEKYNSQKNRRARRFMQTNYRRSVSLVACRSGRERVFVTFLSSRNMAALLLLYLSRRHCFEQITTMWRQTSGRFTSRRVEIRVIYKRNRVHAQRHGCKRAQTDKYDSTGQPGSALLVMRQAMCDTRRQIENCRPHF